MAWLDRLTGTEHRVLRLSGICLTLFGIASLIFLTLEGILTGPGVSGWQATILILIGMSVIILPELSTLLLSNRRVTVKYKGTTINIQELPEKIESEEKRLTKIILDIVALQSLVFTVSDVILSQIHPDFNDSLEIRRRDLFQKFHNILENMRDQQAAFDLRERLTKSFLTTIDATVVGVKRALKEEGCYDGDINDAKIDATFISAVGHFQRRNRIEPADGIFGPSTFEKLTGAVKRAELR